MWNLLKKERWSSYSVGIGIGLLACSSLFLFHKTIGMSTTFVKIAAALGSLIYPQHVAQNSYYQDYLKDKAWIDWQVMLVLGVFLGALISRKFCAKTSPCRPVPSTKGRYLTAFLGGIIVMFGARLAGGCTSGHAITGGFQLALSGWIFMGAVFALGIPTALIIHRKKG